MLKTLLIALGFIFWSVQAQAFCGFYVAKADTDLFNEASKVVMVRDEDKTVLTMVNDYQGDPKEFAMVVPVPTFIERGQIHVTNNKIIDLLDAYTAPRLVEYFDEDPCEQRHYMMPSPNMPMMKATMESAAKKSTAKALGVTVEAEYTVGEYDIQILSAKESDGLTSWLQQEGYKLPKGVDSVLSSYIKQKVRFFVAKVNLEAKDKLGTKYLRPLQVAFKSEKFMLPIRLGTVNAKDHQELFVFALTRKGRVETTNYRTVKIPSNMDVPIYVKEQFGDFYAAMFDQAVKKDNMKTVMLEYAWDMGWCDPCAADPLSPKELRELGVFWMKDSPQYVKPMVGKPMPTQRRIMPPKNQARDVFVTRLHLRYTGETFPEDLMFQQTADRSNFQGRYVLRHPWTGTASCKAATLYKQTLKPRFEKEAKALASLTGWDINSIRREMKTNGQNLDDNSSSNKDEDGKDPWWEDIWDR